MTPIQENVNKHTNKRILVLGSAPHTRLVTAYTWDNLPKYLNVADYDVVILNLEPLLDEKLARGFNLEKLSLFCHSPKTFTISERREPLYMKRSPDFFLTTNTATKFF